MFELVGRAQQESCGLSVAGYQLSDGDHVGFVQQLAARLRGRYGLAEHRGLQRRRVSATGHVGRGGHRGKQLQHTRGGGRVVAADAPMVGHRGRRCRGKATESDGAARVSAASSEHRRCRSRSADSGVDRSGRFVNAQIGRPGGFCKNFFKLLLV